MKKQVVLGIIVGIVLVATPLGQIGRAKTKQWQPLTMLMLK